MSSDSRHTWSRDEHIMAFNLYCKIPFGTIHNRNPAIISLAEALGRTPSAVSLKLANFARLDPALQARGIKGASHGSNGEIEVWDEFHQDWDRLAFESELLLANLTQQPLAEADEPDQYESIKPGRERETMVRVRVNQQFFRTAVLAAYGCRCSITGLSVQELLIASHIVPWANDEANRVNPRNGLCLSAVLDRAFDCGLITVTPDYVVRVSIQLRHEKDDVAANDMIRKYSGRQLTLPKRFVPKAEFLEYHNTHVFRS